MIKQKAKIFFSGSMQIDLRKELKRKKKRAEKSRKRKDLIWRKLCNVVATSGSSVHHEEFMLQYREKLSYDKLPKNMKARTEAIRRIIVEAKVPRMRDQKANNLSSNYELIKKMGGPEKATKIMLSQKGKQQKMKWLRQFKGIGPKYSRDIWMDLYDQDFIDSIALDARVKNFAEKLGFDKNSKNLESELLNFANKNNLTGWELDRLIYNFGSLILRII